MNDNHHQKITADHLKRDAYLYVRQSTLRQVMENTESTKRQYALRQRAVALGWPVERVIVIDSDLGQSGASVTDREGFQRLVSEVGLGRAGVVLGLEVSRLARNCADWHRLLEICALTDTLILDEDGLYNPNQFNDRLLLGLKGAMSEAELHVLKARLQGGIQNKARRGELKGPLPIGFIYDGQDRVVLDPDQQVQQAIRTFFETYERSGSAMAAVKHFRKHGLLFFRRLRRGVNKGQLLWAPLPHCRALQTLHNPRYAGAFFYGRSRQRKYPDGRVDSKKLPQDQWQVLIPDAHPGYITWRQYQCNQQQLRACAQAYGLDRHHGPAGEGPALLQGLVICGVCGQRMTVRYHARRGRFVPDYVCQRDGIENGRRSCQCVPGADIDDGIGQLLLDTVEPLNLQVAWTVQQELQTRLDEADRLRRQQVERARYEADLAERRYTQVDPDNRLVADTLEADWNQKLRDLHEAQQRYEQQREADRRTLDEQSRARILALAKDFPKLWRDPATPDRERKRMVRLLIEDVTLIKSGQITAHVRFKGGAHHTLTLPPPRRAWELRKIDPQVVAQIDRLLDHHTDAQIATQMNQQGLRTGQGVPYTPGMVTYVRRSYRLSSRYDRLREAGMLTLDEVAAQLNAATATVKRWRHAGLLCAHPYDDKSQCLYEPLGDDKPVKSQGRKLSGRRQFHEVVANPIQEVQREA